MKKYFLFSFFIFLFIGSANAQNWTEGFETTDTLTLPAGWSKYNEAPFPIDPATHWNVRDTGKPLPGLASATSKSHSGLRSIGASWWASIDTNGVDTTVTSDVWLVTKRLYIYSANSYMSYWWTAGSASYLDSFQVWISTVDSTPGSFTHYVKTISRRATYGIFDQDFVTFEDYVGQTIWVGFRYYMDCSSDGYFVQLDDFEVDNPVIGIKPIGNEIPKRFNLKQNYPNPFNPVTNIEFDIAKSGNVTLIVYNSMGQEVATLVDQELKAGSYKYDFNASKLASGSYYYRLIAGDYVKTNKMILVK